MLATPIKWTGPPFPKPIPPPILFRSLTAQVFEDHRARMQRANQEVVLQKLAKLRVLARHYGLRENCDPLALALRLAEEFVPGFRVNYGRSGRPPIWDEPKQGELIADVAVLSKKRGKGERDACRQLPRVYKERYGGMTPASLNARLVEARTKSFFLSRFLAVKDRGRRELFIDVIISQFAADREAAAAAEARNQERLNARKARAEKVTRK